MAAGEMQKTYFALVSGLLSASGEIDLDIRRKPESIMLREACAKGQGDRALTLFEPIFWDADYSFVKLTPRTGRTHQLRVHLAAIGHPILGDELYGTESALIPRQALHAATLSFPLPGVREEMTVSAPLPPDICKLLAKKGWEVPEFAS